MPDVASIKTAAEFPSCNKFVETQLSKNSSLLPHLKGEEASKNMPSGNGRNCPVINSRLEGVPFQRKSAKSNRSNSSCSKRPRMSQPEDSLSPNGIEESKDISDKLGSHNLNCTSPGIFTPHRPSTAFYLYALLTFLFLDFFWCREKSITQAKEQF